MLTSNIAKQLISIPSLSGSELEVLLALERLFASYDWKSERIEVAPNRFNLFVPFGSPKIIFTTHVDTVAYFPEQLEPQIAEDRLFGRGACDAKGIAAAMICACLELQQAGQAEFGLLLVVGEEVDGCGAKAAAAALQSRGIKFLINGEPTERKMLKATKGCLDFTAIFTGQSCHSGYPAEGEDANLKLLNAADGLRGTDFGTDSVLGTATVNIGKIVAGVSSNTVSAKATMEFSIRTVSENAAVKERAFQICSEASEIAVTYDVPVTRFLTLPGFPTTIASFASDVPNFAELGAQAIMYGPGSILDAHTAHESIALSDLNAAVSDYVKIFYALQQSR